jgi:hypothetical protein
LPTSAISGEVDTEGVAAAMRGFLLAMVGEAGV